MFVAIGVGTYLGATYHLISQGLFKALAFLAAGSILHATGQRNVEAMGGLWSRMKYTYIGFLVSILAMSGVPPLIGFWSKDWIVSVSLAANPAAAILIVLSSVLTTIYGFRALFKVFHGSSKLSKLPTESPFSMIVPIMVLSIAVSVGWLVFNYQQVLPLRAIQSIDFLSVGASLAAIAAGIGTSYFAFYSKIIPTQNFVQKSPFLTSLRKFLLEGLGFDSFYQFVYSRVVVPLARFASYLQTGILGINSALMLVALLLILFLLAIQVI